MRQSYLTEPTKESNGIIYSRFSHELRNPLSIIVSELQHLFSRHPECSDYEEMDTIQSNLQYMQELLKEFSDFQNANTLSCHPTDLYAYLQDIVRAVKPAMDYLGIQLTLEVEPDLPACSIDRIRMRQVLLNLLRNAQDALPPTDGQITLKACQTDKGHIHISVLDNGCGISKENLSQIFTPFVSFKETGTGLGLAIAKEIVEAHQGRIEVESTLQKGTVFHIFL